MKFLVALAFLAVASAQYLPYAAPIAPSTVVDGPRAVIAGPSGTISATTGTIAKDAFDRTLITPPVAVAHTPLLSRSFVTPDVYANRFIGSPYYGGYRAFNDYYY